MFRFVRKSRSGFELIQAGVRSRVTLAATSAAYIVTADPVPRFLREDATGGILRSDMASYANGFFLDNIYRVDGT